MKKYLIILSLIAGVVTCAKTGQKSDENSSADSTGNLVDTIRGQIISYTGKSNEFEGWKMVLLNYSTGESRVSVISGVGEYSFSGVDMDGVYTLILLDKKFKISSLLSHKSSNQNLKVHQYFKFKDLSISKVMHKGASIEFTDLTAVTLSSLVANDSNGNGVPDGLDGANSTFSPIGENDLDGDGVNNESDFDIDGDGLCNWIDGDDNGNGILDVFELDANGSGVADSSENIGDRYYGDPVKYAIVQTFLEPNDELKFRFLAKTTRKIDEIKIKGPVGVLSKSKSLKVNSEGKDESSGVWNYELADDGKSYDESPADFIYGSKILSDSKNQPNTNQIFFFAIKDGPITREFPFVISNVKAGSIDFSYDESSRIITKKGFPFGDKRTDFRWSVSVFDEDKSLVHPSGAILGKIETYSIPPADIPSGKTYSATVYAQSYEKISGFPTYIIESSEQKLE